MTASIQKSPAAGGAAAGASRRPPRRRFGRRGWLAVSFLAPALILLTVLMIYPVVYSIVRSLFGQDSSEFVGLENYLTIFTDPSTFIALRNNFVWVLVAPFACTALGLVFAVLAERISWSTAFKMIIFMPMAISMLAAGVIFRSLFQEDPNLGAVNAAVVWVHDIATEDIEYSGARPRNDVGLVSDDAGDIATEQTVTAGSVQDFALVGLKQDDVPSTAVAAASTASAAADAVSGTVWLDFTSGGGGESGAIDSSEYGLPGITVVALDASGQEVATTTTAGDGSYTLSGLTAGESYTIELAAQSFTEAFTGLSWLGNTLINSVLITAYVWMWAGFAMTMIAAGLSAMDRSLLDAARVDGANEWQVFRRITVPLLAPTLVVVFVTLIVNVLKIFDLVYTIPPTSSLPSATVIAVKMWTVSFGGGENQGLGSALAVLLLIIVLPFMYVNVKRMREEKVR